MAKIVDIYIKRNGAWIKYANYGEGDGTGTIVVNTLDSMGFPSNITVEGMTYAIGRNSDYRLSTITTSTYVDTFSYDTYGRFSGCTRTLL